MSIIVALLIFAIVAVLAFYIIGQMGIPAPIDMIVRIIVGLILLLVLLQHLVPSLYIP